MALAIGRSTPPLDHPHHTARLSHGAQPLTHAAGNAVAAIRTPRWLGRAVPPSLLPSNHASLLALMECVATSRRRTLTLSGGPSLARSLSLSLSLTFVAGRVSPGGRGRGRGRWGR